MRYILFISFCLVFTIGSKVNALAQNEKLDFSAIWDNKSTNTIKININNVEMPVKCYVYDSSPFTGGTLIKTVENINTRRFKIELEFKKRVYVCIYKDETNFSGKWLNLDKTNNSK